jgi:hypothetical protein
VKTVVYIGGLAAAPVFLDIAYRGVKSTQQRLSDPFGEKAQYAKLKPMEAPYMESGVDYSSNPKFSYRDTPIKESLFNPLYKTGTVKVNPVQVKPYKFSGKLGFSIETQVFESEKLSQIVLSQKPQSASPLTVSTRSTGSFSAAFPVSNIFAAKPFPTRSISQGSEYAESHGPGQGIRVQGYAGLSSKIKMRGENGLIESTSYSPLSIQTLSHKASVLSAQPPQLSFKPVTDLMQSQTPLKRLKPVQTPTWIPLSVPSTITTPSLALKIRQSLAVTQPQIQLSLQETKTSVSPLSATMLQPRYSTPLRYEAKKKRKTGKVKRKSGRNIYELRVDFLKAPKLRGMRL